MLRMIDIYFDVFFFKQKTAYEMRISDWSSDVCSSDLSTDKRHFFSPPGLAFRGAPVGLSSCYDPKNNPVQERHSHESIPWKARPHRITCILTPGICLGGNIKAPCYNVQIQHPN